MSSGRSASDVADLVAGDRGVAAARNVGLETIGRHRAIGEKEVADLACDAMHGLGGNGEPDSALCFLGEQLFPGRVARSGHDLDPLGEGPHELPFVDVVALQRREGFWGGLAREAVDLGFARERAAGRGGAGARSDAGFFGRTRRSGAAREQQCHNDSRFP